ncbi:probable metal-nicotianamine transporter YSL7 [Macadamia integrifolia]|uniref:probable metal-nicotianamine transporter YSL7 n=1 Tax=Macadamia integrifolia TaxID=60698 RepID=UPI001C4F416A|nr:probable metal-nicotianamine transporter YSL7 [Macadamia integrifolia]
MENWDEDIETTTNNESPSDPQLVNREGSKKKKEEEEDELTVEQIFQHKKVPSWRQQLTVRAFVVALVLSILFSFIVMKLNLTTGVIPSLNVSAGLLGFFFVKTWTKLLEKAVWLRQPFTRQENTVIQTCVVASAGISFSGGFGNYIYAMSEVVAKQLSNFNAPQDIMNPQIGWMMGFLFVVSFIGLFSVVPLRKIMIIDFKLTYPSGTATAHLINSFHTPIGAKVAQKQVKTLGKFFTFSFLWGFFQWFFTAGNACGFVNFPTFGIPAYTNTFYFDFSATYIGIGMICPHIINVSLLLGAILSWGIMWPIIGSKKGVWYSASLSSSSVNGLQGYKIFISVAMILGDGLYNFVKVTSRTLIGLYQEYRDKRNAALPVAETNSPASPPPLSFDDERRTKLFFKDQIPTWFALGGYVTISVISIIVVPFIFPPLKWYYIVVIYIFAPILAFCNAYGCGLTDWSIGPTYGTIAIFVIGAWAGASQGGIIAGLAACGVLMNIVSTASDLTQDFKTGYLTLASPRSMFVSQVIGTAMGCVISPCVFSIFYKAFPDMGLPGTRYPAPYATVFRSMAMLGVEGFSSLPTNCLQLCYGFFFISIFINGIRDSVGKRWAKYIPSPRIKVSNQIDHRRFDQSDSNI